jgi:outer membrane protein assembly factor BamB
VIWVPGWLAPGTFTQFLGMFWGPMVGAALVLLWWLAFSRLRWADRLLVPLACAAAGGVAVFLCHESMKFGLIIFVLPLVTTAWVAWLLVTPFLNWAPRRAGLVAAFLLVWGYSTLVRVDGIDGSFASQRSWRWDLTAEDRFLAEVAGREAGGPPEAGELNLQPGDWPGFRGAARDGRLTGVRLATDWGRNPPRQLWRQRIGPGWSSVAVVGTRLYTQEQRGPNEVVVCYHTDTGKELWAHEDPVRFSELVAGAGPRATPTFHEGKLYALGATGRLNCLDAATGRVVWSRDLVEDSGAKVPTWGFASSPLVWHGVVTVFAGGPDGKSVLGFRAASGELAWSAGEGQLSYCSPHPLRLHGTDQVLLATDAGLTAFRPAGGEVLWQHKWPVPDVARCVQPALVGGTDVLLGTGFSAGTRRVHVTHEAGSWGESEVWTTVAIKPYYNDLVVHEGHIYGFDNNFFTCVSLEDGKGRWRARGPGGGYGSGQVLLLADQGLLLVVSERTGDVSLLEASPEGHKVLGRFKALEGKTWNHPVVAHGKLFVRNGEEIACYALAASPSGADAPRRGGALRGVTLTAARTASACGRRPSPRGAACCPSGRGRPGCSGAARRAAPGRTHRRGASRPGPGCRGGPRSATRRAPPPPPG